MNKITKSMLAMSALYALSMQPASALTVTLGNQFFQPGDRPNGTALSASFSGEPAPFNAFIGDDSGVNTNLNASWTFNYSAISDLTSASLALGILDADTLAAGNQVASFTLNGLDLTGLINSAFEANPVGSNVYAIYTIELPSTTFATLATGTANFSLALQGPGLAVLGDTPLNGAALDFSTLNLSNQVTPPPQNVPVPAAAALLLTALPWLVRRNKKA